MKRAKTIRFAAIALAILTLWGVGVAIWGALHLQDPLCGRWKGDFMKSPSLESDRVVIQKTGTFQRFFEGKLIASGTWKPIQASYSVESRQLYPTGAIFLGRSYYTEEEVLKDPGLLRQRQEGTLHPVPHAYLMENPGLICIVVLTPDGQRLDSPDLEWSMTRAPSRWDEMMEGVREWWRKNA